MFPARLCHVRLACLLAVLAPPLLVQVAGPARAEFPPITDQERNLTQAEVAPNAAAVVLFRQAELHMLDLASEDLSSRLVLRERIKVLTEKGKERGEIEIEHSDAVRLFSFTARTVLPDGRVVPLPKDAKFERRVSKSRQHFVTVAAFPEVAVGAILDAEYELRFDSPYYLQPFYFSDTIPVRRAEIVFHVPDSLGVQPWARDPIGIGIKAEKGRERQRRTLRATAVNLPSVPDEPFQVPFADLATQMMLLPTVYDDGFVHQPLLDSWATVSEILSTSWKAALSHDRAAAKRAAQLASAAGREPRDRAAAIYRFVRDEIATDVGDGVFLEAERPSVDDVLRDAHGASPEKAALLQAMLAAVDIDAKPVWAAPRSDGLVDLKAANPAWFDRVLVAVELGATGGGRVFLDPTDRRLGFGRLLADYEGTVAILPDRKKPEAVVLPESAVEASLEQARIELSVDEQGMARGTGRIVAAGHDATRRLRWRETPEKTAEAWKDDLAEAFREFTVADVAVQESNEEAKIEVTWSLALRADEALGDEITLVPSAPIGPESQPFTLPSSSRRSPILFAYPGREEVELKVTWPEGWGIDAAPQPVREEGPAGLYALEVERRDAERSVTVRRRLDLAKRQFATRDECEQARTLFDAAAKGDARALVLVRR